jgi:4-amino-4-deoxychorismate lyase
MSAEGPLRDGRKAGFHLIETMRWEPETGLLRQDLHFARLGGSSKALGFAFSPEEIKLGVSKTIGDATEPRRVRIGLEDDGTASIEAKPFVPLAEGTVWKLRIATTRLSSTDRLLRYKTSRRDVYDAARAEFSAAEADEVLLLNERGEVCEGATTNLFVETGHGVLATPPLECGLLAGVMRTSLLNEGKAIERVLRPEDLMSASRIFVGNSLRGLIEAKLEGSA